MGESRLDLSSNLPRGAIVALKRFHSATALAVLATQRPVLSKSTRRTIETLPETSDNADVFRALAQPSQHNTTTTVHRVAHTSNVGIKYPRAKCANFFCAARQTTVRQGADLIDAPDVDKTNKDSQNERRDFGLKACLRRKLEKPTNGRVL